MGERLVVQFARGSTRPPREFDGPAQRTAPRPRRTVHRMTISGLPEQTSWQVSKLPSSYPFGTRTVTPAPGSTGHLIETLLGGS